MKFDNLDTYAKKGRGKASLPWEKECDDIFTLDIECSNGWVKDGKIIPYEAGHDEDYWNALTPISLCYHWEFTKNEEHIDGRKLGDFISILDQIPSDTHVIIWIQNMEYEFAFLSNYLKWKSVFCREKHKPMKAVPAKYPNVEFRCSYMLTRLSLAAWGHALGYEKGKDFDYNTLRTPLSKLSDEDLFYCRRDCDIVYHGISKYKEKYLHVKDIPLTQTGEIRREVKRRMRSNQFVQNTVIRLIPENARMYKIMKETFQGGYCHGNLLYVGKTVKNGASFDFRSSYPAVMISELYPMSPFIPAIFKEDKIDKMGYLMRVTYQGLESKTLNHYISESKCIRKDKVRVDNGRIISAKEIELWITEQDWLTIKETYKFKKARIEECYSSHKGYLPKELVEYILELYANKVNYEKYKDVPGPERDIYYQAKQFINSLFGMCVTDLLFDDVKLNGDNWIVETKDIGDVDAYIEDLKAHNKGRTFLGYQWGLWISAYARRNLWRCMRKYDKDVVYSDTDSLKIIIRDKMPNFDWMNKEMADKLKKACEYHGLDYELTRPNGKALGEFVHEYNWLEMKTLGAKRYVTRKEDGELVLTVSGINKEAVSCLDNDIENFNFHTKFDKDHKDVKKKLRIYTKNQPHMTWNEGQYDEYYSDEDTGIVIRPTSYSMGIADEFLDVINNVRVYLACI